MTTPVVAVLSATAKLSVALKEEVPWPVPEICAPLRIWRFPPPVDTERVAAARATASVTTILSVLGDWTVPVRASAIEAGAERLETEPEDPDRARVKSALPEVVVRPAVCPVRASAIEAVADS